MANLLAAVVAEGAWSAGAQPTLTDPLLTLRPWRLADADALAEAYQDSEIRRWHARSMTPIEARAWIEAARQGWRQETQVSWAVQVAERLAGRLTLKLALEDGVAEAAYWTLPWARRRRVAPTALILATDWAFDRGLHRVHLEHSVDNTASCRVAERAGFALEGTLRSAALHLDGWHDMHLHARVAQ